MRLKLWTICVFALTLTACRVEKAKKEEFIFTGPKMPKFEPINIPPFVPMNFGVDFKLNMCPKDHTAPEVSSELRAEKLELHDTIPIANLEYKKCDGQISKAQGPIRHVHAPIEIQTPDEALGVTYKVRIRNLSNCTSLELPFNGASTLTVKTDNFLFVAPGAKKDSISLYDSSMNQDGNLLQVEYLDDADQKISELQMFVELTVTLVKPDQMETKKLPDCKR